MKKNIRKILNMANKFAYRLTGYKFIKQSSFNRNEFSSARKWRSDLEIPSLEILNDNRLAENIKFSVKDLMKGNASVSEAIARDGFVVVSAASELPFEIAKIVDEIEGYVNNYKPFIKNKQIFSDDNGHLDYGGRFSSYLQCAIEKKPVIIYRGELYDWDQGMIDIFNPHIKMDYFNKFLGFINSLKLNKILTKIHGGEWRILNTNIYINEGVINTRGLHVDDYNNQSYKVFVYLSDVLNLDDGPYCYAPGTHILDNIFRQLNEKISTVLSDVATDTFIFRADQKFLPLFGEKGTIIISNQSGAHRGFPQSSSGRRIAAVFHFYKN